MTRHSLLSRLTDAALLVLMLVAVCGAYRGLYLAAAQTIATAPFYDLYQPDQNPWTHPRIDDERRLVATEPHRAAPFATWRTTR
jgi:hypothetical protein